MIRLEYGWAVVLALASTPVQQESPAGLAGSELDAARSVVTALAQRLEGVELLEADYEQRQSSLLLAEPLVSRGRLHMRREPGCLVLEIAEPRPVLIRSDARSHQIYYPEKKRAERYLFESNELAKALLSCFTAEVRHVEKAFTIVSIEHGAKTTTLGLQPREKKVCVALASLRLTVLTDGATLAGIAYVNAEGEEVALRLTKVVFDPERTAAPAIFDRPLPDDVQLAVHRVRVEK